MARIRSAVRNIMKRALVISINAQNTHNSDFRKVVSLGVSLNPTEFFAEALKIAWKEEKTGTMIYHKTGKLPRKVMPRIHNELVEAHKNMNTAINNGFMNKHDAAMYIGETALLARHGVDKVTPEMMDELRDYVASTEHQELSKAA
jgi:hypothetical protein